MDQDGRPEFVTGGAGLNLAANLLGGFANTPFSHQIGVWETVTGDMLEGFPREIEDYLFFVNPTVGDVDGDRYPEVIMGSGGYYVRAWNACGEEPEGFPKFTGGWITSSVALGDIDGDDLLEATVTTRSGYLFAWNLDALADTSLPWPEYRHDNRNTGNYEAPLSNGGTPTSASEPLVCVVDAGTPDAGTDPGHAGGGGCDCRAVPGPTRRSTPWLLALALAVLLRSRRA